MKFTINIIFILLFVSNLHSFNIDEAVDRALKGNRILNSKKHELQSYQFKEDAAKSLRYPSIFFDSNYNVFNDEKNVLFDTGLGTQKFLLNEKDYINLSTGVRLNLYTGGLVSGGISYANYQKLSKNEELQEVKLDIIYNSKIAYVDILELKAYRSILLKEVEALSAHYNDATSLYEQGVVPQIDVLQTDVKVKRAKQRLTEIENSIKVAKGNLSVIMGDKPDDSFDVDDILFDINKNIDIEFLNTLAKSYRPILKDFEYRVEALNSSIDIKNSEYKPKLYLTSGYSYSDIQDDLDNKGSFFIQGGIKFQIDWDKTFKERNALKERKFSLQKDKEQVYLQILLAIKRSYEDYITAKSNFALSKSSVNSADEYFRVVKIKYKEGLLKNSDLLDAEAMLTDSMMVERANYFNIIKKIFMIERVVGKEVR